MQRLILFDIDCTLIYCAGAGLECLGRATRELLGFDFEGSAIRPDGWTDPLILRELLMLNDICQTRWNELEVQIWKRYAEHLETELKNPHPRRRVEKGVPELLARLAGDARFALGLLTGNLERTARLKLEPFGLNHYFPIGAYGSDHAERNELGRIAQQRARDHFGRDFSPEEIWVIGDTARDIACARALGARALAVATGGYSVEDLQQHSPDVVLSDLADVEDVIRVLGT